MAVELTLGLNATDDAEAEKASLALQTLLLRRLGDLTLTIHRHGSFPLNDEFGGRECRFLLHEAATKNAQADMRLIKNIRNILCGGWKKTDHDYMDLCLRPHQSLSGVLWIKADSVNRAPKPSEAVVHTEGRGDKERERKKKEAAEEAEVVEDVFDFMPKGLSGQIGYLFLSAICIALVLVGLKLFYHAFSYAKENLGMNWVFGISAVVAIWIFMLVREINFNVGGFALKCLAAVIAGSTPEPKSIGVVAICTRGLIMTACILGLLDLWSVKAAGRHLWQGRDSGPTPMSSTSTMGISSDVNNAEIQGFLRTENTGSSAKPVTRQGVRIAVPKYLGGHSFWVYANGKIVGRHWTDSLTYFQPHKTDSGLYVYSREGKLLVKTTNDDLRPIFYAKDTGAAARAYDDESLYQLIDIPLAPGGYRIEILDIYSPIRATKLYPLYIADETKLEVTPGKFVFHATKFIYRWPVRPMRALARSPSATPRAVGTPQINWVTPRDQELNRIQRQFDDDHMRRVLDKAGRITGAVSLNMTKAGLGMREFDTEQVLHMRKWLRQEYEGALKVIEN